MSTSEQLSTVGIATATGPRDDNQDAAIALIGHGVFAVADGMGGLADGRASAKAAVDSVVAQAPGLVERLVQCRSSDSGLVADLLEEVLSVANDAVRLASIMRYRPRRPPRSGCTLTVAILVDDAMFIAHLGDTRALLVDSDSQHQLTVDHSVAAARVRSGRMTVDEAARSPLRSRLYQACGLSDELDVDVLEVDLEPGARVVLCSDGLWETVPLGDVPELVLNRSAEEGANALVEAAAEVGLVDNTTAVVIDPARGSVVVRKVAALSRSELFAGFSLGDLQRIAPYVNVQHVREGDVVVREGSSSDRIYVLGSGRMTVERAGAHLTTLAPPQHFGELAMLRKTPQTAALRAEEDGWVLALPFEHIHALIRRCPSLGARLSLRLASSLADRVVATETSAVAEEP